MAFYTSGNSRSLAVIVGAAPLCGGRGESGAGKEGVIFALCYPPSFLSRSESSLLLP